MLRTILLSVFASTVTLACGGSVEKVPDQTSSESPATPGASKSNGSSSGAGGTSGNGTCTAAPSCNKGDTKFETSAEACIEINGVSCYERSTCGTSIWCQHTETAECDGYPECNPGETKVTSCVPDAYCQKYSSCGVTIYCMKECEGPAPICDPGDKQVPSSSDCLQDDAKCYSRTTCNFTIWCTGPA